MAIGSIFSQSVDSVLSSFRGTRTDKQLGESPSERSLLTRRRTDCIMLIALALATVAIPKDSVPPLKGLRESSRTGKEGGDGQRGQKSGKGFDAQTLSHGRRKAPPGSMDFNNKGRKLSGKGGLGGGASDVLNPRKTQPKLGKFPGLENRPVARAGSSYHPTGNNPKPFMGGGAGGGMRARTITAPAPAPGAPVVGPVAGVPAALVPAPAPGGVPAVGGVPAAPVPAPAPGGVPAVGGAPAVAVGPTLAPGVPAVAPVPFNLNVIQNLPMPPVPAFGPTLKAGSTVAPVPFNLHVIQNLPMPPMPAFGPTLKAGSTVAPLPFVLNVIQNLSMPNLVQNLPPVIAPKAPSGVAPDSGEKLTLDKDLSKGKVAKGEVPVPFDIASVVDLPKPPTMPSPLASAPKTAAAGATHAPSLEVPPSLVTDLNDIDVKSGPSVEYFMVDLPMVNPQFAPKIKMPALGPSGVPTATMLTELTDLPGPIAFDYQLPPAPKLDPSLIAPYMPMPKHHAAKTSVAGTPFAAPAPTVPITTLAPVRSVAPVAVPTKTKVVTSPLKLDFYSSLTTAFASVTDALANLVPSKAPKSLNDLSLEELADFVSTLKLMEAPPPLMVALPLKDLAVGTGSGMPTFEPVAATKVVSSVVDLLGPVASVLNTAATAYTSAIDVDASPAELAKQIQMALSKLTPTQVAPKQTVAGQTLPTPGAVAGAELISPEKNLQDFVSDLRNMLARGGDNSFLDPSTYSDDAILATAITKGLVDPAKGLAAATNAPVVASASEAQNLHDFVSDLRARLASRGDNSFLDPSKYSDDDILATAVVNKLFGDSTTTALTPDQHALGPVELLKQGYDSQTILTANFPAFELALAGFSPQELQKVSYTPQEILHANYKAQDLETAGFGPNPLLAIGYTQQELLDAGYTPDEVNKAVGEVATLAAEDLANLDTYNTADLQALAMQHLAGIDLNAFSDDQLKENLKVELGKLASAGNMGTTTTTTTSVPATAEDLKMAAFVSHLRTVLAQDDAQFLDPSAHSDGAILAKAMEKGLVDPLMTEIPDFTATSTPVKMANAKEFDDEEKEELKDFLRTGLSKLPGYAPIAKIMLDHIESGNKIDENAAYKEAETLLKYTILAGAENLPGEDKKAYLADVFENDAEIQNVRDEVRKMLGSKSSQDLANKLKKKPQLKVETTEEEAKKSPSSMEELEEQLASIPVLESTKLEKLLESQEGHKDVLADLTDIERKALGSEASIRPSTLDAELEGLALTASIAEVLRQEDDRLDTFRRVNSVSDSDAMSKLEAYQAGYKHALKKKRTQAAKDVLTHIESDSDLGPEMAVYVFNKHLLQEAEKMPDDEKVQYLTEAYQAAYTSPETSDDAGKILLRRITAVLGDTVGNELVNKWQDTQAPKTTIVPTFDEITHALDSARQHANKIYDGMDDTVKAKLDGFMDKLEDAVQHNNKAQERILLEEIAQTKDLGPKVAIGLVNNRILHVALNQSFANDQERMSAIQKAYTEELAAFQSDPSSLVAPELQKINEGIQAAPSNLVKALVPSTEAVKTVEIKSKAPAKKAKSASLGAGSTDTDKGKSKAKRTTSAKLPLGTGVKKEDLQ
jgi:hypothetical protein